MHGVYTDHEKSKLLVQEQASALAKLNPFINKTMQYRDDHYVKNCDPNKQKRDEVHSDNTFVASDIEHDTLTYDNVPKGSGSYLRPKIHIQHTHPQHLSTSTQTSINHKNTHCNRMG